MGEDGRRSDEVFPGSGEGLGVRALGEVSSFFPRPAPESFGVVAVVSFPLLSAGPKKQNDQKLLTKPIRAASAAVHLET